MATITNLTTLKINYLSQSQYDTALANGQINSNELYFTPQAAITPAGIGAATNSHVHGNITNDGKIGTAADKGVYTTTDGVLTAGTIPVAAGGTGVASFTANSLIMSGSSTTANLTTRAITNNTSNTAITNSNTNIPTMNTIYYGLVAVNGASQSRATTIYAPTATGTANQILVSTGSTTKTPTWKATANGAAYATSANGELTFGTLPVQQGGTGLTTATNKNAVVIGNSSTVTNALQTVRTGSGAFYATAQDAKPSFGTLPIAQGGTGATSAADARTGLGLGTLATKSSIGDHSYTPAGTIAVNGTTSTATVIKTATFNTVVTTAAVSNEILTISTGASGSSTNQTGVRIADPAYKFTGTAATLSHSLT